MTHGSLFSGIGGFDLGFARCGIRTVWQVEIDEYCRRVLEKHFPHAQRYGDIREFSVADSEQQRRERRQGYQEGCLADREIAERSKGSNGLRADGEAGESPEPVDIISGGFPCQPVSVAGKRRGKDDDRYLWPEMLRVISALKPRWVVAENVYGLVTHEGGELLDKVYSDLEAEGYETLPSVVLPACAFGAPHQRYRVWIVAHRECESADRRSDGAERRQRSTEESTCDGGPGGRAADDWWSTEPGVGRVAHGVSRRVDRLKGLGNAIVPQIAELIGRTILEVENG